MQVTRVYSTLLPRVVRNPRSRFTRDSRPLLFAVFDLPAVKHQKENLQHELINNGLHMHGILIIPHKSRLKTDMVSHFEKHENIYVKNRLRRLHVEAIHSRLDNIVDYVFKSVRNGKLDLDDILILPKASSELQ